MKAAIFNCAKVEKNSGLIRVKFSHVFSLLLKEFSFNECKLLSGIGAPLKIVMHSHVLNLALFVKVKTLHPLL